MKKEKLRIYDLFYIFIFGSVFGWIVEVMWSFFKHGSYFNHSAVVLGPFNFVYGIAAMVLSVMLFKLRNENVFKIFLVSFATGSVLEYIMSYWMENVLGFVAWDYSAKFLNINGRICLVYSIFWGVLGVFWIKVIFNRLKKIIDNSNHHLGKKVMTFLILFLCFDLAFSMIACRRGRDFEQGILPQNKFEEFLDEYFGIDYLNNMYNNRWDKVVK